jgi:hypothetical protein
MPRYLRTGLSSDKPTSEGAEITTRGTDSSVPEACVRGRAKPKRKMNRVPPPGKGLHHERISFAADETGSRRRSRSPTNRPAPVSDRCGASGAPGADTRGDGERVDGRREGGVAGAHRRTSASASQASRPRPGDITRSVRRAGHREGARLPTAREDRGQGDPSRQQDAEPKRRVVDAPGSTADT